MRALLRRVAPRWGRPRTPERLADPGGHAARGEPPRAFRRAARGDRASPRFLERIRRLP